jgi:ribosomal protein L12E/L44/L45/RPP1/RPP2
LPGSKDADFTNQLIIVDSAALLPEYRSSENQIASCTHGNGAIAGSIGTSVFCKELLTGNNVTFGRHQILGIVDPTKLPNWAKRKLGMEVEKPSPEPLKDSEKHKKYALIKHGQSGEIDHGTFETIAEAKQYAAERSITNYTIKKLNKESLLENLDKNKAKIAQAKAVTSPTHKATKTKEARD